MKENDIKHIFGLSLKTVRESKGYTQEALAELVGVQPNSISRLESGVHFVKVGTLTKICNVLNTHPSVLFSMNPQCLLKEHTEIRKDINLKMQNLPTDKLISLSKIVDAL